MEWLGASESSSHREVARRVNAEHFLPVYGGEDVALGYGVPIAEASPQHLSVALVHFLEEECPRLLWRHQLFLHFILYCRE